MRKLGRNDAPGLSKFFARNREIAVPEARGFSFDALLQRIHPAPSRVKRLALETPAIFVVFDLLAAEDGRSILAISLRERVLHPNGGEIVIG